MNLYKYDELTKEYTGVETAYLDPLESKVQGKEVFLLPANATFTAPLVPQGNYVPVWNETMWEYKEDNRGKEYWLADDEYGTPARTMKELGAFPANAVFETPKKPFEMVRDEKIAELKNMRDSLEVEPVEYNGNYFDYDEKARDRIDAGIIFLDVATQALGKEATISWTTADNTEAIVTANDLRGVIANVAIRSNELHVKYRGLREQVDKATTIAEIEVLVW